VAQRRIAAFGNSAEILHPPDRHCLMGLPQNIKQSGEHRNGIAIIAVHCYVPGRTP
jgi:hypothetical protein